jgi:hypothetical protein
MQKRAADASMNLASSEGIPTPQTRGCGMYRIELKPGEETVFRTIEELAVAVQNGLVTPRARIYHNASQKWLPIEFHPHYKQALAMPATRVMSTPPPRSADHIRADTANFAIALRPHDDVLTSHAEPAATPPSPAPPSPASTSATRPPWSFGLEPEEPFQPTAPKVAPEPPAPPALPAAVASPVLELPKISYPEITPAEEPVAHTGSTRPLRPIQLAGAFVLLAAGGYFAMSFLSPVRRGATDPAPAAAVERSAPRGAASRAGATGGQAPEAEEGERRIDQAADTPPAPASSGFAAALDARAITNGPAPRLPAGRTPAAGLAPPARPASDSAGPITPAPDQLDLDVQAIPVGESLISGPRPKGDSAMKRILRAVSGKEETKQP